MSKKLKKLNVQVQEHLEENEEVIASVLGAYEVKIMGRDSLRNGTFLATDRRIVFFAKKMFGYDLESFPYSNISSIEMSKSLMGHTVSFFASGNKVTMKWINHGDVEAFMEKIKSSIGKKSESQSVLSSADELKKFAELRDQGVITQEDFEAKKKQILGL